MRQQPHRRQELVVMEMMMMLTIQIHWIVLTYEVYFDSCPIKCFRAVMTAGARRLFQACRPAGGVG